MNGAWFDRDAVILAQHLLGASLRVDGVGGMIVETEAYRRDDEASHSYPGPTRRNAVMFSQPGSIYIYRSYGLHWCLNIVCETGSAVLIRALQPLFGLEEMMLRRGQSDMRKLCNGPGNLCQALGVTLAMNGSTVLAPPFLLEPAHQPPQIVSGPRIGISKAVDRPWRFAIAGSSFLSRPVRPLPPANP